MGRYEGHITHSYSSDSTRPTFEETIQHAIQRARIICLQQYLDKLEPNVQEYVLQELRTEGYIT